MPTLLLRTVRRARLHHLEYQWRRYQEHHHHQQELLLRPRRRFLANRLLVGIQQWSHRIISLGSPVQHLDIFPSNPNQWSN